jgi:hypothetical protein
VNQQRSVEQTSYVFSDVQADTTQSSGWVGGVRPPPHLPFTRRVGRVGRVVRPGAWTRDIEAELDALGCDAELRKKFILGGSAAAWAGDSSVVDYTTWEGTMAVAERLWAGSHGLPPPPPPPPLSPTTPLPFAQDATRPSDPVSGAYTAPFPPNLIEVAPRFAVQSCRMKMRGFTVSAYKPSTHSLGGELHWCVGGPGGRGGSEHSSSSTAECFPCPAVWEWDQITSASYHPGQ